MAVSLFVSGYLFNKVNALEKQLDSAGAANLNAPALGQQAPQEPAYALDKVAEVKSDEHIRGDINKADFVLVEYSDYECPFCKRFHDSMKQVMEEYGDKVAWVYRHYPLDFHQNAQMESEAAECVAEQKGNDGFWKFTDEIYTKTASTGTSFTKDQLVNMATSLGINGSQMTKCMDDGKYTQKVKDDMANGVEVGISGTPGTVVIAKNGKREIIPGALPYEQVKQIIDSLN